MPPRTSHGTSLPLIDSEAANVKDFQKAEDEFSAGASLQGTARCLRHSRRLVRVGQKLSGQLPPVPSISPWWAARSSRFCISRSSSWSSMRSGNPAGIFAWGLSPRFFWASPPQSGWHCKSRGCFLPAGCRTSSLCIRGTSATTPRASSR